MLYFSIFLFTFLSCDLCLTYELPSYDLIADWDLLIFTQQWPEAVCKEWKEKNPSHICVMPSKPDSWSIHGIWPTKLGTIGPAFCNSSWHFDQDLVQPIEKDLINWWPPVEEEKSMYSLWAHEWNKHGTCAAILENLNSELKYFSKGLEWIKKYSMTDILNEASIIPSNTQEYGVEDIYSAIKVKLGVNPAIECKKDKGVNYLQEIRICFDKNLQPVDCDGIISIQGPIITNCHGDVLYIADFKPANNLYVQMYKIFCDRGLIFKGTMKQFFELETSNYQNKYSLLLDHHFSNKLCDKTVLKTLIQAVKVCKKYNLLKKTLKLVK